MATTKDTLELRGECPRLVVEVLDAISLSKRISRTELVNKILKEWARDVIHESQSVQRVTKNNPALAETDWAGLE